MRNNTIISVLRGHAESHGEKMAFILLDGRGNETDSLTYRELYEKSLLLSHVLASKVSMGSRALLVYRTSLEFFVAFFACLYAGIIAVPVFAPRKGKLKSSTKNIVLDCRTDLMLVTQAMLDDIRRGMDEIGYIDAEYVATDCISTGNDSVSEPLEASVIDSRTVAFLQYTSGSTSNPKGVVVNHGNLISNLEMIADAYELTSKSTRVGWVPHYHDLGLIFNAIQSCHVGALCVVMAPLSFVQHPWVWINAISKYSAEIAMAPNSAYGACVDQYRAAKYSTTDLSCWNIAINGAEPVRAETIERFTRTFGQHGFRRSAFHPGFGMAEATLVISGGRFSSDPVVMEVKESELKKGMVIPATFAEKAKSIIGCGRKLAGEEIRIVDPDTCHVLPFGRVGEIWVSGPHIAQGYWENREATAETFQAKIAAEGERNWLRTGDLGFLDTDGELYITGRKKDVIIVQGENHYPQDIEYTVEDTHPALRKGFCAAIAVGEGHTQQLVVAVEIKRSFLKKVSLDDVRQAIARAVVQEHGLSIHDTALVRTGLISKTTSGKIRRSQVRQLWYENKLEYVVFDVLDEARAD